MKVNYKIKIYPWARSYHIAQHEKNVLIYTINRTLWRENKFHWLGQFTTPKPVLFYALAKNTAVFSKLNSIKNLRVGSQIGTANVEFLEYQGFRKINRVSHLTQTIGMLLRGRLDLIIASPQHLKNAIVEYDMSLDALGIVADAFTSTPSFAMSLQTNIMTVNKFRQAFAKLKRKHNLCRIKYPMSDQCSSETINPRMIHSVD
ncbi:MAG: transporter substrate-binding domain-containing protein [Psychrobium sp.]|nr:transporter substrate-binding domain-containing protein [Psychrobium sp.]